MTSRPSATTSPPGGPDDRDAAAKSPPATAVATKSMATNNKPLPRNTVATRARASPARSTAVSTSRQTSATRISTVG